MKRSTKSKFLRRIRIRGGEFDASARAMHRKAAVGNVSIATIERKIMSTKTTFKRIALVAVAAVGFGMLSGVAANAANTATYVSLTGTTINTVQATTLNTTSYPALDATQISGITTDMSSPVSLQVKATSTGTISSAGGTVRFQTDTLGTLGTINVSATDTTTAVTFTAPGLAGTYTGHIIVNNGSVDISSSLFTLTVGAATVYTLNHSTAFINTNTTVPATVDSTAITTTAAASITPTARLSVQQYSSADSSTVLASANTAAVVVSISGGGSVSTQNNGTLAGPSAAVAAGGSPNGLSDFYVYPNGVAGAATVTVSVNGVVVATKAVIFAGTLASYSVGIPSKTVIGVGSTGTVVISGLDSNNNPATLGSIYVTSATPAVALVAATGNTVTVTGMAVGTSVITVTNGAVSPTPLISTTFTVTVGKATAKTVTMTFDKASYASGEKMVLTVTAMGSDGTAIGDNAAFNAFGAAVTSNVALQGTLPGTAVTGPPVLLAGQVAIVGGVGTFILYAPLASGTINLSGVEGSGTDNVIAGGTAAAITATADVTGDTTATDAANAATDAANYAADAADAATTAAEEATAAAQAAQDSADAAMAAVVALALRVNHLYAATRTQVLRLQALLVRLIKKLHA